jgi:uncharacterized protein YgfB (UPF0149 family)
MKNYSTYVNDARRLSSVALSESEDPANVDKKLQQMREHIRQSRLTVYQKEFLLNQLCAIREMAHA